MFFIPSLITKPTLINGVMLLGILTQYTAFCFIFFRVKNSKLAKYHFFGVGTDFIENDCFWDENLLPRV